MATVIVSLNETIYLHIGSLYKADPFGIISGIANEIPFSMLNATTSPSAGSVYVTEISGP